MLILPLPGDIATLKDGSSANVASFSPYKKPLSILVLTDGTDLSRVPLGEIASLNGVKVKLVKDSAFETNGRFKRAVHLPQPHDKITAGSASAPTTFRLSDLVFLKSELTKGIFMVGKNDLDQTVKMPMAKILNIQSPNGSSDFSLRSFLSTYAEYIGLDSL